ncbi:transposase [Pedobacter sp. PAMC26386]|nr:transposase [Pedobacter sp. PAMC26386]
MDPSRLSKWRNNPSFNGGKVMMDIAGLSDEQMEIRRLKKALKNVELERDILKKAVGIFSKGRYGSPHITKELNADGIKISRPRIARLMLKNGIKSIMKKKYRINTNSSYLYPVNANLLLQDFSTTRIGEK